MLGFDEQPPRLGQGPAPPSLAEAAAVPAWLPGRCHCCWCQFSWRAGAGRGGSGLGKLRRLNTHSKFRISQQIKNRKKCSQTGNPTFQASCTQEQLRQNKTSSLYLKSRFKRKISQERVFPPRSAQRATFYTPCLCCVHIYSGKSACFQA